MTLLALLVASTAASQTPPPPPAPEPLRALPHAALMEGVRALERDHGALAHVVPIGTSRGGREILGLRLASGTPASGKPAILIVADIDGSQTWSSSLALFEAQEIVRRAGEEPVAALLDAATLFVVPCANPDAHERRFATPRTDREGTGTGADDDRDGRQGEDPQSDLDGDGQIAWLRVEDPKGEWSADPNDARILIKADAKKGERGRWKLWPEGRDLDRDEKVAEDSVLDACVNRNFAYEFKEHAPESGAFPMDEPEARALADFVLLHPEISLAVVYGHYDDLVEKPKTTQADAQNRRVPAAGVIEKDADVLVELGKRYAELTGNKSKGRGGDAGTLQGWLYAHRGMWTLAIDAWDVPLDAKDERTEDEKKKRGDWSDDVKRLKWIDANADEAWRFIAWHEVQHPELGKVEVGGFAPFARTEPPVAASREIAQKQLDFLLTLGGDLASARILEFVAKPLGGDVYQVEASVANGSRLAVQSASAIRTESVRPLRVRLALEGSATLLAGQSVVLERDLAGGGAHREYRWLVRSAKPEDIVLKIDSDHAGSDERRAEVKK